MRLALLSDIHGNPIALDAVLADISRQGDVDGYWFLGDLVAIGYDPVGVLERITALPAARFVQGNTDRYVVTGDRPYPSVSDVAADPSLLPRVLEVAHSFAWTCGYVTACGWMEWLVQLPPEGRVGLPDGSRVLMTHVAPGHDDGRGIQPDASDAEVTALVASAEADLVCVGHTHAQLNREAAGVRVVNPGSVSNPRPGDPRASYALLDATANGYAIDLRRVEYDYAATVEAIRRSRHPAASYIARHWE